VTHHVLASVLIHGAAADEQLRDALQSTPPSDAKPGEWAAWEGRVLSLVDDILYAAGVRVPQTDADLADAEGDREHDRRKGT